MANREAVLGAWAVLAMAWPDRVNRLTESEAAMSVLLGAFESVREDDLLQAAKSLVLTRSTLYPDDNPIAILLDETDEQEQRRLSREADNEAAEAIRLESISNLSEQARRVSDDELAYLEQREPMDPLQASIFRMRCKGIRARLATSEEDREALEQRLARLIADAPKELTDGR